ncbi:MAG: alpha-amylase/4-alpha-glucanotransferase domain-containing protein [Planctomycetota bacterium]|nr:alpha-amylase/4-alpha-glucanotransferase domain-containing protein [Planctomycetota bacterium]
MQPIRFIFALHDHQPIGNFDGVFDQAYHDSYKPMLDLFESYPHMKLALHTSGPLMEWLDVHYPDYLDRLAALVHAGRIEIVGGAFHEPILGMLSSRDRIGQITTYSAWLENRLGADIRGMWIPERVWEQSMAGDLATAGIQYTILDDSHFKNAGLNESELHGYYLTEDDGKLIRVFPGSERLRYVIPFGAPEDTIEYLRQVAEQHPNAIALFADDGEKFGVWPDTKKAVFEEGWLCRLFDLLAENQDWIRMTTPSEAIDNVPPLGTVYLPEGSYREMTEWVLPPQQLIEYESARSEMQQDPRWPRVARFMRGGFWRNFKVRYPEANEMYARMMMVSRRLQHLIDTGHDSELIRAARSELYRGQCNCPYWHGAFGGIYLPHLRNAIYTKLISADNLLDRELGRTEPWVEAISDDFNFDGRPEVQLVNDRLSAFIAPSRGGQIYELDIRTICHNLLATLSRRPEAYHRQVLLGPDAAGGSVIDANAQVKFKQPGLENRVQYDSYTRKSLQDHFYDDDVSPEAILRGEAMERGDFLSQPFDARVRRKEHRIQVQLTRNGNAWGIPIKITKGVTLDSGSSVLEIAYLLEGLPTDRPLHFAVEFNFAGIPSGASDRYFYQAGRERLGDTGTHLNMYDLHEIGMVDEWLGLDTGLSFSRPTHVWTYPIETVSQSEGGFELVHQSVVVQPHWYVQGDADGRWSMTMRLHCDTALAESRMEKPAIEIRTPAQSPITLSPV